MHFIQGLKGQGIEQYLVLFRFSAILPISSLFVISAPLIPGGATQQSFIRGGSARRFKPLPLV